MKTETLPACKCCFYEPVSTTLSRKQPWGTEPWPFAKRLDLHIFVLLEDSVCIKHGSIIHFFHIGTRLGSLEKEKLSVTQSLSSHISLPLSFHPFPSLPRKLHCSPQLPNPGLGYFRWQLTSDWTTCCLGSSPGRLSLLGSALRWVPTNQKAYSRERWRKRFRLIFLQKLYVLVNSDSAGKNSPWAIMNTQINFVFIPHTFIGLKYCSSAHSP